LNRLHPKLILPSVTDDNQEYFLATTSIEEFWDTSKNIIFLGEWCTLYNRSDYWQSLNGTVMPSIWNDKEYYIESGKKSELLYDKLLPILANTLNKIHGQRFSDRYWHIVAGQWLLHYIGVIFDRYHTLIQVTEKYPKITTIGLSSSCIEPPEDTYAFTVGIDKDFYNLYIYSQLFQEVGIEFTCKTPETVPTFPPRKSRLPFLKKFILHKLLPKIMQLYCKYKRNASLLLITYFPFEDEIALFLKSRGRLVPFHYFERSKGQTPVDQSIREKFGDMLDINDDSDPLYRTLLKLIPTFFPRSFLEGYDTLLQAERDFPNSPKNLATVINMQHPDELKHCTAACVERGTNWIGIQHGGNTGMLEYNHLLYHEIMISDYFLSWGWTYHHPSVQITPLPSSKLSSLKEIKRDSSSKDILFISTSTNRYFGLFQEAKVNFSDYLQLQMRFANSINDYHKNNLVVRLHNSFKGWGQELRWQDNFPDIRLEKGKRTLVESFSQCRICVIDNLSTTYAEALTLNIPTILYWEPSQYTLRKDAVEIFDELRRVGILHNSPESAAAMVNKIYSHVESWWEDPERVHVRKIFCERYAYRSSTAHDDWIKFFKSI
jgi:putative transferase (TIGR04331 family)